MAAQVIASQRAYVHARVQDKGADEPPRGAPFSAGQFVHPGQERFGVVTPMPNIPVHAELTGLGEIR